MYIICLSDLLLAVILFKVVSDHGEGLAGTTVVKGVRCIQVWGIVLFDEAALLHVTLFSAFLGNKIAHILLMLCS